jgi:hypothetical protein
MNDNKNEISDIVSSDILSSDIVSSVERFNNSISKLEQNLSKAVSTVAQLAHNTGFEEGRAAIIATQDGKNNDLIIREELMAAKSREKKLEQALFEVKQTLTATICEVKNLLGAI